MLEVKLFLPLHYDLVQSWAAYRGQHFMGCDIGVVLFRDGEPETGLFAFINKSSEVGFLHNQISKPGLQARKSHENLNVLLTSIEDLLYAEGIKFIVNISTSGFGKLTARHGYVIESKNMTESIKCLFDEKTI